MGIKRFLKSLKIKNKRKKFSAFKKKTAKRVPVNRQYSRSMKMKQFKLFLKEEMGTTYRQFRKQGGTGLNGGFEIFKNEIESFMDELKATNKVRRAAEGYNIAH